MALVRSSWNHDYLHELADFPVGVHDDQVDASSCCFNAVALEERPEGPEGRHVRPRLSTLLTLRGCATWGRRKRRFDITEIYLTVTEAASKYGFHPKTIRRWIHVGELPVTYPSVRTGRSGSRIRAGAVDLLDVGC